MYEYYNSRHNKEKICTENKGYVTYIWDIDGIITLVITISCAAYLTEGFKIVVTIFVIRFSNSFHHHFFLQMRKWKQNEKQPWPLIFVILLQTVWELLINSVLDVQFLNAQQYFFSAMNNTFRVKSMLSALHWRFYRPTITMMKSINISKHLFFPSAKLCNSEC